MASRRGDGAPSSASKESHDVPNPALRRQLPEHLAQVFVELVGARDLLLVSPERLVNERFHESALPAARAHRGRPRRSAVAAE